MDDTSKIYPIEGARCPECKGPVSCYWHTPATDHPELGQWLVGCDKCEWQHYSVLEIQSKTNGQNEDNLGSDAQRP